jgi:hypothetical protein
MNWVVLGGVVVSGFLMAGCGASKVARLDDALYRAVLTRSYAYPPEKCFEAVQRSLLDMKLPIEKADPKTGVIWSGRAVAAEAVAIARGYYRDVGQLVTHEHRITLRVEGSGNQCSVRATKYEVWTNNEKLNEIYVNVVQERVFEPFLVGVQDQLERGL